MSDCQSVANAISHNFTKPTYCNNDCWTVCCPTSRKSNQTIETYQIPSNPKKRQHCTVEKNNMPGKCLPLLECGSVMEALRNDITAIPTICDNDLQTVCCPSISELSNLL